MNHESTDTSIKKVDASHTPLGTMGQQHLVTGTSMSMRLWDEMPPTTSKEPRRRDYETVGFVVAGRAELEIEGQIAILEPGDSWVVPAGAEHTYRVLETFTAVEATSPPAEIHARDEDPDTGAGRS